MLCIPANPLVSFPSCLPLLTATLWEMRLTFFLGLFWESYGSSYLVGLDVAHSIFDTAFSEYPRFGLQVDISATYQSTVSENTTVPAKSPVVSIIPRTI